MSSLKSSTKKSGSKTAASSSKAGGSSAIQGSAQGSRKDGVPIQGKTSKDVYLKKLAICSKIYDYKDEKKDEKAKEHRMEVIRELQKELSTDQKFVVQVVMPNIQETMDMIERNIFRPLPNVKKSNLGFAETGIDQEEEIDPSWPALQGIYEFFLQLVVNDCVDVKSLKTFVQPQFV